MRLSGVMMAAQRGGREIFSDINFEINTGDILSVTGPNGAGKSTFLKMLAGLFLCSRGQIHFEGNDRFPTLCSACHYIGHENAMKPELTVHENLHFWTGFAEKGEAGKNVEEALEMMGMRYACPFFFGDLSSGQKRRVSLARLAIFYRPVWLLDEPMAGLDYVSQKQFLALIQNHRKKGGMIVMATHPPFIAEESFFLEIGTSIA